MDSSFNQYEIEELHMILDKLKDAIFVLDEKYVFLRIMISDESLLILPPEQIIGKSVQEIFWKEISDIFTDALDKTDKNQDSTITYQLNLMGKEHYYKADIKQYNIMEKKRYLVVLSDITQQEDLEKVARHYKQESERQIAFQKLLFEISSDFLDVKKEDIEKSIQDSLGKIGDFVKADRCYLVKYDFEKQTCTNLFEWCCPGIAGRIHQMQAIPFIKIPDWARRHQSGEVLYIEDSSRLEDEAEKYWLEQFDIKTLLAVPIMSQNGCFGYLGLNFIKKIHEYQELEQRLLSNYGQLLLTLLKRKSNEEEIIEKTNEMASFFLVSLDFLCILDPQGHLLKINKAWEQTLGYEEEEIIGKSLTEFAHENDMWQTIHILKELEEGNVVLNFVNRIRNKNNEYRYIEWSIKPFGKNYYAAARDISGRKIMENSLFLQKELYKTTLHSIGDGVISFDETGNIKLMNKAATEMCDIDQKDAIGDKINKLFITIQEPFSGQEIDPINEIIKNGKKIQYEQLIIRNHNNEEIMIEASISPVYSIDSKIQGSVMIFKNITEERKKQIDSVYLSLHDYLTGLYNRRFFEEEMIRLDTKRNLPFSIMMLDVNGLKLTNDAFGHENGDLLLKKVAEVIKSVCRLDEIAARLGGDEFAILLVKAGEKQCDLIAERIQNACSRATKQSVVVSVAIGYATKTNPNESVEETLRKADSNMYLNKLITGKEMKHQTFKRILGDLEIEYETGKKQRSYISYIAMKIGEGLHLPTEDIKEIEKICMLHDIGEIVIPKMIYKKKGTLTEEEYSVVKRHPEAGYQILKSMEEYSVLATYVLSHHEKWDGSGYPRKLKGESIPLFSRIISIADAYEAMTSGRSYKKALSKEDAKNEIIKGAGTSFDPELVKVFNDIFLEECTEKFDKQHFVC